MCSVCMDPAEIERVACTCMAARDGGDAGDVGLVFCSACEAGV